jgi:diacylglycerol kinase family enzyme
MAKINDVVFVTAQPGHAEVRAALIVSRTLYEAVVAAGPDGIPSGHL